jgi:hypothetical protein
MATNATYGEPWTYPSERYYYTWYEVEGALEPRDDEAISGAIQQRLRLDPYTRDYSMEVMVRQGIVTLRGEVGSLLAKRAAGDDAWDTPGVIDVNNEIVVPRLRYMAERRAV